MSSSVPGDTTTSTPRPEGSGVSGPFTGDDNTVAGTHHRGSSQQYAGPSSGFGEMRDSGPLQGDDDMAAGSYNRGSARPYVAPPSGFGAARVPIPAPGDDDMPAGYYSTRGSAYQQGARTSGYGGGAGSGARRPEDVRVPESITGEDVDSGANNTTGGVVRPKRRAITGKRKQLWTTPVERNYRVADGVQFNNLEEVFQDTVSPEFGQEILESAFKAWGLPFDQPVALKFGEDLVFAFIVAVTASDKADYNKVYDIPVTPTVGKSGGLVSSVEASMGVLSDLLTREYGVTRRQLARGLADRIRAYLADPENIHVLDDIATKVGCDRQMAGLAFDGSTHCKGMNVKEIQFTKTLENRNLFEREDQMASGASDRLLNSLTNGVRAVR